MEVGMNMAFVVVDVYIQYPTHDFLMVEKEGALSPPLILIIT